MTYEFRRVFFPWSWEANAKTRESKTPAEVKEYFRIFLTQVLPAGLLGTTLTSNRVVVDLVNFKGREPSEVVLDNSELPPANDHELLFLIAQQDQTSEDAPLSIQVELNTPFAEFKGSDMVFRTAARANGPLPEWALLSSLLSGVDYSITGLRAGATRYRKRFGSSLLGVSPVIEEQILIDYWNGELGIEYRHFNLSTRALPDSAWVKALEVA